MTTKHTTVILPNKEIQDLKEQVTKLTAERDQYQKEAIEAKIKVEKMKFFIEYLQSSGGWYFKDGFWKNDGYKLRTTQELFEYYLICKDRGLNGC